MTKPWSSKKEYKTISGTLAKTERLDFQAAALPLIRAIWPAARATRDSRTLDRCGIDHLVWPPDESSPGLVVQTKGFDARTRRLGSSQIQQCLHSIERFASSGITTDHYVLVHNRDARDTDFRRKVEASLCQLVSQGTAKEAELLDRQTLIRRAFDEIFYRLETALSQDSLSLARSEFLRHFAKFNPIKKVPVRLSTLRIDQHRLRGTTIKGDQTSDPVNFLSNDGSPLRLLLGGFGFGKTTAALRATTEQPKHVLFVPARTIPDDINSTKEFLLLCIDSDRLFINSHEEDLPTLKRMVRPCLEYLLSDPKTPVTLVLDGLDESAFLSRRGSLQHLFNILRPISIPIILTMRTEFWNTRQQEFSFTVGEVASHGERQIQRLSCLELLPWTDKELRHLIQRIKEGVPPSQKERLSLLEEMVGTPKFETLFGDIPRRPLFLRQVIDFVAERGAPDSAVDLAQLMTLWIELKVYRDIVEPTRQGGRGRVPVSSFVESASTALSLAWKAMVNAAGLMTRTENGNVEMLSTCTYSDLLASSNDFSLMTEPTGLILHSVLTPIPQRLPGELRLQFSHRSFQEFFLAHYVNMGSEDFELQSLPATVCDWIEVLQDTSPAN